MWSAIPSGITAAWPLNLDHVRTQAREQASRKGPRNHLTDVQHADSSKRPRTLCLHAISILPSPGRLLAREFRLTLLGERAEPFLRVGAVPDLGGELG